ncbi:MAG TPA: YggS family pyridoxal phosphate-dependent enzyme [Cyclobacteriaceae bacterium]|nr:YggS family pyridoxal phosphate-dependent enzyme [Cyclobacteriaceae bacterium]
MSIKINIEIVTSTLAAKGCRLIAVSKTHPPELVQEAYDAGQRIFGENKVQEMTSKYEALPKDIQWHLIGHLQTNKVKYIAPWVGLIHSVDSPRLAEEIDKQGKKAGRVIPCLLQVHIAREETKFGFDRNELMDFLRGPLPASFTGLSIDGLMGMATLTDNQDQVRSEFRGLRTLLEEIGKMDLPPAIRMKELSMGMSGDYKIAMEEGSTMVRIGTAIFGAR